MSGASSASSTGGILAGRLEIEWLKWNSSARPFLAILLADQPATPLPFFPVASSRGWIASIVEERDHWRTRRGSILLAPAGARRSGRSARRSRPGVGPESTGRRKRYATTGIKPRGERGRRDRRKERRAWLVTRKPPPPPPRRVGGGNLGESWEYERPAANVRGRKKGNGCRLTRSPRETELEKSKSKLM